MIQLDEAVYVLKGPRQDKRQEAQNDQEVKVITKTVPNCESTKYCFIYVYS